jgi:hypothetical protein
MMRLIFDDQRRATSFQRTRRRGHRFNDPRATVGVNQLAANLDVELFLSAFRDEARENPHRRPGLVLADRGDLHPG